MLHEVLPHPSGVLPPSLGLRGQQIPQATQLGAGPTCDNYRLLTIQTGRHMYELRYLHSHHHHRSDADSLAVLLKSHLQAKFSPPSWHSLTPKWSTNHQQQLLSPQNTRRNRHPAFESQCGSLRV